MGTIINLGSGPHYVGGWINFDKSPNIFLIKFPKFKQVLNFLNVLNDSQSIQWDSRIKYLDIRKMSFPERSVDNFYLSHVFEHLYYNEAKELFYKCFVSLKIGGLIKINSPDYGEFIAKYLTEQKINELETATNFNDSLLSHPQNRQSFVEKYIKNISGHVHYWHPFRSQIHHMLINSGFSDLRDEIFGIGQIPNIEILEFRSENSFNIEARKSHI